MKYKLIEVEEEGTANDGLHVAVKRGKQIWRGYLELVDEIDE